MAPARQVPAALQAAGPTRAQALRDRVSSGIVAAAAEVFARHGAATNMAEVAAAAGVARATVYRYFPTRQALLERLAEIAVSDAGRRLEETRLEQVDADEGVTRAARALLEVGDYLTVIAREGVRPRSDEYERRVLAPLRRLFERGQRTGAFRSDIPAGWLTNVFVELVVGVAASSPAIGRDDTVAAVSGLFLDGARAARKRGSASRPTSITKTRRNP